jgi:hypothetical protein
MVEYYPKNNIRPVIAALIVGVTFIAGNEIFLFFAGVAVPRFIAIPLATIVGTLILIKMNSNEEK